MTTVAPTLLLVAVSASVHATQFVDGAEHDHQQVNISANEQNRLAIKGGRISSAVPSQKGALSYVKDDATGSLYFSLANPELNAGTVTLFVTDDKNITYQLILVPRPIAGEEIVIDPPASKVGESKPQKDKRGQAYPYQRQAKNLIWAMFSNQSTDIEAVPVNQEVPLWQEVKVIEQAKYPDGDMVGEKYDLTNISSKDMLLLEQEFYRKDTIAISIEHMTLPPGADTEVYVVRRRGENE